MGASTIQSVQGRQTHLRLASPLGYNREGVTSKRTLENQDELIRTNMTTERGNLPTIFSPDILFTHHLVEMILILYEPVRTSYI